MNDDDYIRECIALASATMDRGNPPFASLLVIEGEILAKGSNTVNTDGNFMRHGEMNMLENALQAVGSERLPDGVIYSIGEPCPMCASAIYWSGIARIFYGARRAALRDVRGFGLNMRPAEIYATGTRTLEVVGPIIEDEVVALVARFYE